MALHGPGPIALSDHQRADIHHLIFRLDQAETDRLSALAGPSDATVTRTSNLPALVRAARAVPAGATVCLHTGPGAAGPALIAIAALRSRGVTVLHWARAESTDGEPSGLGGAAQRAIRSRAAALGETPEEVARLGSAGSEAWLAPYVTLPSAEARLAERARWGGGSRAELFVGPLDAPLAAALAGMPASEGALVLWGPGTPPAETGRTAHVEAEATTSPRLPAAIAAADRLLLTDGHAYAPRLASIAAQVGTPVVRLAADASAGGVQVAFAAAGLDPHPTAQDPADAAAGLDHIARRTAVQDGPSGPKGRPEVSVVAWTNSPGRTLEIAQALGGEGRTFYDLNITDKRLVPLRYLLSSTRTVAYLVRNRPRVLVIVNPPIFPPVIGFLYSRLTGARLLLDSQTASFGEKGSRLGKAMLPIHTFIAKRAAAVLVGAEGLAERVRGWGGQGVVFHEAPPTWKVMDAPAPRGPVLRVLWIGVFAGDEPLEAFLDAARAMPEVEFRITGDLRKAPAGRDSAPPNVVWLGFVRRGAFPAEVESADIVVTMTTDPASALRGGAEAAVASRPLVTTDVPFLRDLFPHAVHTTNDGPGIVAAIRQIDGDWAAAREACARGVAHQEAGWLPQLAELRRRAGVED